MNYTIHSVFKMEYAIINLNNIAESAATEIWTITFWFSNTWASTTTLRHNFHTLFYPGEGKHSHSDFPWPISFGIFLSLTYNTIVLAPTVEPSAAAFEPQRLIFKPVCYECTVGIFFLSHHHSLLYHVPCHLASF